MSSLHVAVTVYFNVLHLVTEKSIQRRWSIMVLKILQNSPENSSAGVSINQINTHSMGRPDEHRSSRWRCSVP